MQKLLLICFLLCTSAVAAEEVDFALQDLKGASHSLSDYRGKWVIVNYWATWCPPCLDEIPGLVDFYERHKDTDAVVLGVNFEEASKDWLQEFVDNHFISYPVLRSDPLPVTPLGPVLGLPTTYIVSPEGRAVARQQGPVTAEALDAFIQRKADERRGGTATTAGGG
jgi:thiol-disulfide isomerase/thioredoxin